MIKGTRQTITTLAVSALVWGPVALHHAAAGYLRAEDFALTKIFEAKVTALRYVGLQPIPAQGTINSLIDSAADKYGIKRPLLHSLAVTESGKSPTAVSVKGAIGVLQVMPFNAARCALSHPGKLWDEATNIDCGARILAEELAGYKGNVTNALKAYNGGPKCVKNRCAESEAYVLKIVTNAGKEVLR